MTISKDFGICRLRCRRDSEALYLIARKLSSSSTESEILRYVLTILESRLDMARVTLLLLSADGEKLVYAGTHVTNIPDDNVVSYRRGEGVIGKVLQGGCSVIIPRISDAQDFHNRIHNRTPQEEKNCSFVCVPVVFDGKTIGALTADIEYEKDRDLSEDERLLGIVAGLISHDMHLRREAAIREKELKDENQRLRLQIDNADSPQNMIGCSDRMRAVYQRIGQVAPSDTTVLIRGESGTGKELVASAIHNGSPRADKPFVKLNCAALSESLLESELFGHEKGAFTGAVESRIGRMEEAEGGTLFLDEIGDFSPAIQVKMLRVLQEKEFSRVGSNEVKSADIRFVVATNRDLEDAVKDGGFRQDLYYRINVFPLILPPLRERREDILPLANHFVQKYGAKVRKSVSRISTTAIDMMMAYHWPGNVRELENCVEYALLLCNGEAILGSHLPPTLAMPENDSKAVPLGSLRNKVEQLERDMLMDALKRTDGNIAAAARELGLTARMARYKVDKLNINYKAVFGQ